MLTVVGLLVYALIQRHVRLYLHDHRQQLPGNKGLTTTPTAAVVLALFTSVMLIQLQMDQATVQHTYGVHPHHLLVCDALAISRAWHEVPEHRENSA
jgi:hypothetical protein